MNNIMGYEIQDKPFLRSATLDLHHNVRVNSPDIQDIEWYANDTPTSRLSSNVGGCASSWEDGRLLGLRRDRSATESGKVWCQNPPFELQSRQHQRPSLRRITEPCTSTSGSWGGCGIL